MTKPPIFSADSIGKSFGARRILKAASLWAYPGAISVILGRNGCGKSTLFRIAAGMLAADHGVVRFRDKAFERPSNRRLAELGLFFLPDRNLMSPRRTLKHHFDVLLWYHPDAPVEEVVERLELREHLHKLVRQLSGGERRRAEIAMALARNPVCLIADEPFAGISPKDAEDIGHVLYEFSRRGHAVVVSGHEVPQLLSIADDVTWMNAGTTMGIGDRMDVRMHDQFQREYLGQWS